MNRPTYYYLKTKFAFLIAFTFVVSLLGLSSFYTSLHGHYILSGIFIAAAILLFSLCHRRFSKRIKFTSNVLHTELHRDLVEYRKLPPFEVIVNAFWIDSVDDLKQLKVTMDKMK